MIKKMLRLVTPPIFVYIFRRVGDKLRKGPDGLFDNNDIAFKEALMSCKIYGEYGCGQSTQWVAANTSVTIYSVDSSQTWVENVKKLTSGNNNINIHWVDLGEIGDWGRPLGYEKSEYFNQYTDWIWNQQASPDCVLVDGRFRVACFLTTVLRAVEGTKIIFDDYAHRNYYHIVEKVLPNKRVSGRQAVFLVPNLSVKQREMAEALLVKFRYVMD